MKEKKSAKTVLPTEVLKESFVSSVSVRYKPAGQIVEMKFFKHVEDILSNTFQRNRSDKKPLGYVEASIAPVPGKNVLENLLAKNR